jgi:hypothetical protein
MTPHDLSPFVFTQNEWQGFQTKRGIAGDFLDPFPTGMIQGAPAPAPT